MFTRALLVSCNPTTLFFTGPSSAIRRDDHHVGAQVAVLTPHFCCCRAARWFAGRWPPDGRGLPCAHGRLRTGSPAGCSSARRRPRLGPQELSWPKSGSPPDAQGGRVAKASLRPCRARPHPRAARRRADINFQQRSCRRLAFSASAPAARPGDAGLFHAADASPRRCIGLE